MFLAMLRMSNNGKNNVLFFGLSFVQFGHDFVKLPAKRFDVGLRQSQTNLVKLATKQTAITTVTEVL